MKNKKLSSKRNKILLAVSTVVVLGLITGVSYTFLHLRTIHNAQKTNGPIKATEVVPAAPAVAADKNQAALDNTTTSSTDTTSPSTKQSSPSSNVTLQAPFGNFVSNHYPTTSQSAEQSVCSTSPGATCTISFTSTTTGVVKTLESKVVDASGSAYWNWNYKESHLAADEWKVTATATLGSQTLSTADSLNLVTE